MFFIFVVAIFQSLLVLANGVSVLPFLNISGFAWAENLIFDGLGHMFVSEAVRGELWRIKLSNDGLSYDAKIFLDTGFKQFGGLAVSPNGQDLYAGVTFEDKSFGIIKTSTTLELEKYDTVAKLRHQPNGLAADWKNGKLYYTDEGTGSEEGGTLNAVDVVTGIESIVMSKMDYPDGLWFDEGENRMFVGELVSKRISTFITSSEGAKFEGQYIGLNEALNKVNIIDDIAIYSLGSYGRPGETVMLAADWTGKSLQKFALNGTYYGEIKAPSGIQFKELTSVRWGKGMGFDLNSVYVTEGGGVVGRETNRRVIQVQLNP